MRVSRGQPRFEQLFLWSTVFFKLMDVNALRTTTDIRNTRPMLARVSHSSSGVLRLARDALWWVYGRGFERPHPPNSGLLESGMARQKNSNYFLFKYKNHRYLSLWRENHLLRVLTLLLSQRRLAPIGIFWPRHDFAVFLEDLFHGDWCTIFRLFWFPVNSARRRMSGEV